MHYSLAISTAVQAVSQLPKRLGGSATTPDGVTARTGSSWRLVGGHPFHRYSTWNLEIGNTAGNSTRRSIWNAAHTDLYCKHWGAGQQLAGMQQQWEKQDYDLVWVRMRLNGLRYALQQI